MEHYEFDRGRGKEIGLKVNKGNSEFRVYLKEETVKTEKETSTYNFLTYEECIRPKNFLKDFVNITDAPLAFPNLKFRIYETIFIQVLLNNFWFFTLSDAKKNRAFKNK